MLRNVFTFYMRSLLLCYKLLFSGVKKLSFMITACKIKGRTQLNLSTSTSHKIFYCHADKSEK